MARREEQNIFSTSFIDMICVALCSQIIMWITTAEAPAPAPKEKQIRFFEITQFGVDHFCLQRRRGGQSEEYASVARKEFTSVQIIDLKTEPVMIPGSPVKGVTVQWMEGVAGKFAGGFRIIALEGNEELSFDIPVATCIEGGKFHYIRSESSFLGEKTQIDYFLCEDLDLVKKKGGVKVPEEKATFAKKVIGMPANGKLRILVPKFGKIRVICPDDHEEATKALLKVLQASP